MLETSCGQPSYSIPRWLRPASALCSPPLISPDRPVGAAFMTLQVTNHWMYRLLLLRGCLQVLLTLPQSHGRFAVHHDNTATMSPMAAITTTTGWPRSQSYWIRRPGRHLLFITSCLYKFF